MMVAALSCGPPAASSGVSLAKGASATSPADPARPAPVYVTCEQLGGRRFASSFCVRAEEVRLGDTDVRLCDRVFFGYDHRFFEAVDDELARGLSEQLGVPADKIEIVNEEGLIALANVEACAAPWPPREPSTSGVTRYPDPSRPIRIEVLAARGFTYRVPPIYGTGAVEVGRLHDWPCRPVRRLREASYAGCEALAGRADGAPTDEHADGARCVSVRQITGRVGEPLTLCPGLELATDEDSVLRLAIQGRIGEHLAVCEHELDRGIEARLVDGTPLSLSRLDGCVDAAGQLDSRGLEVEVEAAEFRYNYALDDPFVEGRMIDGRTSLATGDQPHEQR